MKRRLSVFIGVDRRRATRVDGGGQKLGGRRRQNGNGKRTYTVHGRFFKAVEYASRIKYLFVLLKSKNGQINLS